MPRPFGLRQKGGARALAYYSVARETAPRDTLRQPAAHSFIKNGVALSATPLAKLCEA